MLRSPPSPTLLPMTDRQRISSGSRYEKTIGFSRALRVGRNVYISGTAPIWPDGSCDPDPEIQARRCLEIILEALAQAGGAPKHVVRTRMLVADLKDGGWSDVFGAGPRWSEAKQEFRRATGQEPGGTKRADLRIGGPEGVYLRFVSFGEDAEHDPVPELGPYAVVIVGRRGVEADGDALATRTGTNQSLWELTGVGGSAFVGVVRPDIAFRTRSTQYHQDITRFRAAARPAPTPNPPTTPSRPT